MKQRKTSEERMAAKLACTARWRLANADHVKAYAKKRYEANKSEILAKKTAKRSKTREADSAYSRAYYQARKIERLAYAKAYRQANKAIVRARMKAWRDANKDVAHSSQKAWKSKNPGVNAVYCGQRRARKAGSGGKLSRGIIKKLMTVQGGKCVYCCADLSPGHHLDHKIPLSRGGTHTDDNVHLTCPLCNLRKHDKTHEEFLLLRSA